MNPMKWPSIRLAQIWLLLIGLLSFQLSSAQTPADASN